MNLPRASLRLSVHCAAFMYGTLRDLFEQGGAGFIRNQGTMSFIRLDGQYLGITNEHCLGPSSERNELIYQVALGRHTPVRKPPIFSSKKDNPDFPFDIAIFKLDDNFLTGSTKAFVNLVDTSPALAENDIGIAVGFPGHRRRDLGALTMAHEPWQIVAHCQLSSDRNIWLRDTMTFDAATVNIGGLSGGPLFRLGDNMQYDFVGITYEQCLPESLPQGQTEHEVVVVGFPLTYQVLGRMVGGV